MLIGILSDSHGKSEITRLALQLLKARGAQIFIHLGDICDYRVLEEFLGYDCRIVFGNCDDVGEMRRDAQTLRLKVDHPIGTLEVDGKRLMFTHGDQPQLMANAIAEGAHYLLHGHTHEIRDERIGSTRVINPGALHRAARYTVALLDPAADRLEFIEIFRV